MNNAIRMILRYVGLTMAVLGGLLLLPTGDEHSGSVAGVAILMLAMGVALVFIAKSGKNSTTATISTDQQSPQSNDTIKPLHILAVVTVYAAIPWGIVCLVRKKRRTGWFLILGPFVLGAVVLVVGLIMKLFLESRVE